MRLSSLLLLLYSLSGFAQPHLDKHYALKQYTTYDGLVQSQVNRIVQDSKGYLWICTKGGLSRFDGKNFQNFIDPKDGQRINIQDIVETSNGFIVSSVTKFFRFNYQEETPEIWSFEDIAIPGDYRYYVTTSYFLNKSDNSLYIFNVRKDNWTVDQFIHIKYDLTRKQVQILPFSTKPIILNYNKATTRVCISTDCIYILENGAFTTQPLPAQFDNFAMNPMDSTIYAWQKSTKAIFRLSNDFKEYTPVFKNIPIYLYSWAEPNTFIINQSGQFIFLDENRQICTINHSKPEILASLNFPRHLFISRENNLWVSTEEGVINLFKLDIEEYTFNITKSIDNVWSIVCGKDSTMWFGGYSTGVWSLNKKDQIRILKYKDFNLPASDTSKFRAVYMGGIRDREGRIYIPSANGLLIIDRNQFKYRYTKDVPMSLYDDADNNRLIIGKIAGLEIIEKGSWKTILNIPSAHNLVSLCINREGNVMASSFRKQFIVVGDSLRPYPSAKNLGVISMVKDDAGNIWKATPVGLFLDNGKTEKEIFPEIIKGSISAVFIKKPWLLVTTVKNLFLINLNQFYSSNGTIPITYGSENGYFSMDGGQNGFCEDNEGKIFYTVTDKVLRFSLERLADHITDYLPKPHFVSVSNSKNAIDWLRMTEKDSMTLVCKHDFNSIRFTMFAVSETRKEKLTYEYRLKGMSNEWSQPTQVMQQTFTNLPPGNYQIEIRSSCDGEHWSDGVQSQKIIIQSAWWQTWWAIVLGILLFGGLIASLTILLVKNRQKLVIRNLQEQKRLNELRLQSVRSKNIPHFSGNALANIEHFIFSSDLRQANKFLTKYSKLMNITLRDADQASRSIKTELEYVKLYLELEKMRFGDRLEFTIEVETDVNQERELPNMLMQTWVENAIKHGIRHKEGTGKINISIATSVNQEITVCVADNGVGRAKAKELRTTGTGQGLKILDEQIKIYNLMNTSKIRIITTDLVNDAGIAEGTRFEITIPAVFKFDF